MEGFDGKMPPSSNMLIAWFCAVSKTCIAKTDLCYMQGLSEHDKTNKVTVRPPKTQISLGIRPVWSEYSLSAWRKLGSLATH